MSRWAGPLVAVAALYLCLACGQGGSPVAAQTPAVRPSPSPSLDAATQAYLSVIHADGGAYEEEDTKALMPCDPGVGLAQNKACTPALNLATAKTLQKLPSDLAGIQPPARWAQDDHTIRANLPTAISMLQAMAKAYDANDDSAFITALETYSNVAVPIQTAITDIDPSVTFQQ